MSSLPWSMVLGLGALVAPLGASAVTLHVPGAYPTIQSALAQVAQGDTVLLAPGRYQGTGNHDLIFPACDFVLRSEAGPEATVLDGSPYAAIGLYFDQGQTRAMLVDGISIVRMATVYYQVGSAVTVVNAHPTIRNCIFAWNEDAGVATENGQVLCVNASPLFENCTITTGASIEAFFGGIQCFGDSHPELVRSICWGNCGYDFDIRAGSTVTLTCCVYQPDVSGTGLILEQSLAVDPRFCSVGSCDDVEPFEPTRLRLREDSPCLPANHPCGLLIGALSLGCPANSAPEDPNNGIAPAQIRPNPTRDRLELAIILERPGPIDLELIDIAGRVVCRRQESSRGAGPVRVDWDLAATGCRVPSGAYLVRALSGRTRVVRTVTILR